MPRSKSWIPPYALSCRILVSLVDDDKVDGLLRRGFTRVEEKKAPAKKAASSKKSEK